MPAAGAPAAFKEASLALTGGRFVEAETICRAALVAHPRHARLRAALGAALRRQRRTDEAEAEFREVARLWPRSPAAHVDLGVVLFEQRRWARAPAAVGGGRGRLS